MSESAWEDVPWMVGGGVKHSTNVARLLAYAAFGGQEGIVNTPDLLVRERAVPDGTVRVAPGACSIINRNPNVQYDAYAARLPAEDVVSIGATGSGGWRTDLIVARVENPFLSGEPYTEPTAPELAAGIYQFTRTHVYPGILSGSTGSPAHPTAAQIKAKIGNDSAIPLASIALPASTGTMVQAYIRDQRQVAQTRESSVMRIINPGNAITLSGTAWITLLSTPVTIPDWATHFSASALLSGVSRKSGNLKGSARLSLGTINSETTALDDSGTTTDRIILAAGADAVEIDKSLRGTSVNLTLQFQRTSGLNDTAVNGGSSGRLDAVFHSRPSTT